MLVKMITGVLATLMALGFFVVPILKLKDPALIGVIVIGVVLMLVDLAQKLRSKED
ncbi:MAG: hypothetical protein KDH20_22515 [Rhodocyclaceae bacterium]|nr:hypothetical protein [Rhodocyclaceae bacterium]